MNKKCEVKNIREKYTKMSRKIAGQERNKEIS